MSNTEILGRSTPYTEKRVVAIYILLMVAVLICTAFFVVRNIMDPLQIALTVATLGCCVVGLFLHFRSRKEVLLYDDHFEVGGQSFDYAAIRKIECARGVQITFTTGQRAGTRHTVLVGNGDALVYLINRKRKELRRKK